MAHLTKDAIIAAEDRPFEDVEVPEWGGTVRVSVITGTERDEYEASVYQMKGKEVRINREDIRAKLLAKALVDGKGARLFTDAEVKELGRKSSKVMDRLFTVAQRLNGMTDESIKDLEKN